MISKTKAHEVATSCDGDVQAIGQCLLSDFGALKFDIGADCFQQDVTHLEDQIRFIPFRLTLPVGKVSDTKRSEMFWVRWSRKVRIGILVYWIDHIAGDRDKMEITSLYMDMCLRNTKRWLLTAVTSVSGDARMWAKTALPALLVQMLREFVSCRGIWAVL